MSQNVHLQNKLVKATAIGIEQELTELKVAQADFRANFMNVWNAEERGRKKKHTNCQLTSQL
jgi:hypothetical protein